jgi:hypothetical protein
MPHAQALVLTDDPARPAGALARRLAHEFETEWAAESGFVRLAEGLCTFHSWPEGLRLDAFADTSELLGSVERFITEQLTGDAGVDAGLRVDWYRRPLSER